MPTACPAILLAVYHGKADVAQLLVELGAPIDIFEASALGKVDRIAVLLRDDPVARLGLFAGRFLSARPRGVFRPS